MPKFLNLISQSGKDEYVDISEFNKNPNAYGKYKIRMVDDATGKNYNIPATMFGEAQKDGLRAWNMEKQTTKQKQVQNPQPKTAPSYQDMLSGDYWSKQLGAKQKQDILPTQEKAGLDLPNLGGQEGYVDRTMDVLYNEQKRFAKSQAEMERIQKELGDANKRAEALKKQISEENQRRQDTAHVPTYGGFYAQLPQNSNYAKQLKEEQKNIAQLSKQLNENEYYQRNLRRLEETARGLSTEGALEAQQSDAQMPWYANPFMSSNQRVGATINQPNEKQRQASTILENVKQTRRLLREASLSDDSWYNKLGRGLWDAARDINTWDSGINAVNNALSTLNAKRGYDQGKATAADKAVLESAAIKNATSQKTKDAISAFYNAGITTTNMVPFMAQIVSSPFNNVGRSASSLIGRTINNMLTQTTQGALLQRMLPQVVYRAAVNGMKGIGRFAGDVAGGAATALTFANQKMLADAANRYQGQHTGQFTADGRFEYTGSEKTKGKYQALLEAFATQAIEYQSELVGEYFTPLNRLLAKGLGKAVGYGTKEFYDAAGNKITSHFFGLPGHKISLDKTVDLFSRLSNAEMIQAFNKFTKATKFNGVIGEYLEEVVGNMENATLGINDANWGTGEGGVFNPEENMETFLAVAVGSGFMAGLGGPVGLMHKASINRAYNRANADGIETFNLSAWQAIRDQIDYAPVPELPNIVLNIMNGMNDNQKRVVQNYAAFSVAKQGSLMSEFKDQLEKPHVSHVGVTIEKSPEGEERYFVTSSDEQYNVLQKREFKTEEEANAYVARVDEYIKNGRNLQVLNQLLSTVDGTNAAIDIALDMSEDLSYISELFYTDPLRRSDTEQAIVDEFVNRANGVAYPSTEVNEPHETQNGQDLADGAPIGDQATIDTVNQREANAISHWNEVADPDLQNIISIFTNQGNPSNEIVEYLRYNEYSEDIISAFCELCNAKVEKDGFMSRTGQRIEEQVNQKVQQVTFAGQLNGEETPIILQVQDQTGVPGAPMYIVSGNISVDDQGTLTSDGLIILRDEQGNFIQRPDTNGLAIVNTQNAEDYRNQLLTQTQEAVTAQIQATEYKAPEYNDSDMETQAPEAPQGSGLTVPQPVAQPADTNEQPEPQQEQEPAIPTDEDGNLLYHKAPIEATILDLYNGELDDEEIRDFVQNKINESSKEYDKANKKKPKIGTDKNAYLQAKTQWQSQVDEAKQQLDYWNSVQNYIQQQTHTTPEEIKAAQDELSGTTARLEYARQSPEGATTPEQIAGEFVKNAKIQPEDFYRETGLTATDARKQYPGMLSNNGATIASLAEQLVQYDNDNYGGMFFKGDDMEARNYIIEALKNAPSRKSLGRNMTAEEQEYVNQYEEQREAFYQDAYGMSYSDYLAFEEQEMPNIWRRISNFAPEQYDQMVAEYYESLPEDYFTPQNEQQNGTEGQQDNGLADSTTVLPQPPTDNEAGSGQREDPAAETGTGSEGDNQNEEVPGGTQGVDTKQIAEDIVANATTEIPYDTLTWNPETNKSEASSGTSRIISFADRKLIVLDIFGFKMPFYCSSGHGGKANVEAGKWYPFFGISPNGWMNKGTQDEINRYYDSDILKAICEELDRIYGDVRNDESVPKVKATGAHLDFINQSVTPAENGQSDTVEKLRKNINDTIKAINERISSQYEKQGQEQKPQEDETAAAIKKDIEDFIAKSTHDVQITNYDEKEFEAQISVDGKPSNIVITPPMEYGETMSAEYRPTEGGYQELGDLLDEYNEGLEPKEQGFDGEHLAAIFSSVDAAIDFEKWLNDKEALATEQRKEEPATVTDLPAPPEKLMTAAQELLAAIESNDKQAIDNAKANVEKVINNLSHSDVSRFAYDKNNLVKQQNSEARKEAYKFVCKVAKKRADALIQQLNERINESYPGVRVEYNANGFWLNTTPDSKYKQIVKALDNDRRWLTETGLDASVISPINNDTFDKWIKSIGDRLSEQEESLKEKTWDEMDENEKMEYVFSHPLLTEEQIKNAQTNEVNKANALAYIKGQKSMVTRLSYFITYKNVKHNTGSSPANNEAGDTSQLDETNSGGDKGRRAEGKHSGLGDSRLDTEGSGQTNPNQSGEQLLRSEDGKRRPADDSGKEGDKQVPGVEQPVGRPDTGSDGSTGSGIDNGDGHNVYQQGGKGRSRKNTDANRRGADKANRDGVAGNTQLNSENIDSQLQSEIDEFKNLLADYRNIKNKKNGNINSSIIPGVTINSEKIEAWGRLIYQGAKVGYLILRKGHTSLSEWSRIMKDMLTPAMHDIEITDAEIDEFINEMWHCNLPIGDEVHTISEWSRIIQKNKLKEAVRLTLEEKKKKQLDAESVEVKIADKNNIAETLPYLLPLQQDDVYKAEMQFFDESHNDYDHAYGKGYMFTNGTGTGKTYTGLGIVKRFIKQGKGRVLILTPSSTKVKDWVLDAANLNIKAHNLEEWAKAHKTTATTSKAEGVVVTTYANFRQNQALLEDEFDLVIYDESHRLLENKKGGETEGSKQHYMLTNKDEQWAFSRLQTVNQTYQEIQKTRKQYDSEYDKEKEKFQDEADAKFYLPMLTEHISKHEGYPNLKAIKEKYDNLVKKYNDEVKPQLEKQAKESVKKTKVVFLSATPFNTKENLGYAEGYIFQYPQTEGRIGRRNQFYLTNFGSAYRWRNNRLESRTTNPEAVAAQEVAFSDYLQNQLGTMSGRVIDSEYDYSRDFPTVTFEKADELNTAFEEIKKMEGVIHKAFYDVMTNYQYTSVLFEAMKTSCILPRIREHINAGRKVVLFHRRMESARPITPPFQEILNKARILLDGMTGSKEKNEAKAAIADYEQRFAHMLEWEKTLDLRVPRVQILEEFGGDSVLFFSGKETTKQKNAAVEEFNRDSSPKKIIVIQEASGKEGISLHDVTGENQRVLISLAMPQSPITALQIEGRIYRIGNKSNAIFEYPLLGLDEELITWGQRFNAQVGTTENLALGSKARNLRESFARAVIEHSGDVPLDTQGTGGKEMDEAINQDQTDPFDKSILDFYGNARISGKRDNREGKDYYPTPEPLGFMMVKWANLSEGESVLEPSAGHGAIARYVPASNQLTSVEPSTALFGRLQVLAGGIGRKFENDIFENYNIINKHDVVLMNPPFGTAGRLAIDHVAKAFKHLSEGGRIVAIIPRGSADAKFDKWIQTEKSAALVGEIQLPNITFQNAGTQVACRVVVIDKISNEQMRNEALENATQIELPNNYDKIEDFFEDLRGITMPARTIDQKTKNDKKIMPIIKEFKDEYGDDFSVEFTPTGVIISGVGFDYLNMKGDMLKSLVAAQYARANKIIRGTPSRLTRIITTYETIKKMALKLADMSEEEMDDYVAKNIKDGTPKKPIAEQFKYEVKKNTRTGEDMHVASKNSGVVLTDDEYNSARSSAKANGGYWSRYAGGFVFPSEVAARTFLGGGYINSDENSQQSDNRLAYSSNTNNVNNSRIIPEDVDKDVSLQIENEFDSAIENLNLTKEEKDELDKHISDYSNKSTIELEDIFYINNSRLGLRNEKKNNISEMLWRRGNSVSETTSATGSNLRNEKSGAESPTTENGEYSAVVSRRDGEAEGENTARGNEVQGQYNGPRDIRNSGSDRLLLHEGRRIEEKVLSETPRTRLSSHQRRLLAAQYAISRELVYRDIRLAALKQSLGLEEGKQTSLDEIAAIFEKTNTDKEVKDLFDKILAINKRLGTSVDIQASQEEGASGEAGTRRDVYYYLDGFTRTSAGKINIPVVIAHELLHQGTIGAINLVKKGKAEGVLTKEQIDAVNTIIDIYNKVKANPERLSESKRGLANPYEFAAQMVDPRQRRALSMSPLERVIAAANELRTQGNPSLWQRIKNALKTLFGMSDLKKMDKAINTLLDTFSETVHDISMNDVDQSGWGYFIGEQGASNMDKAEEATTRLDNLNVARYFENQGKDPKTIKWATGWERGADGKWRYEIPDFTFKPNHTLNRKNAKTTVIGKNFSLPIAKLSDVIDAKELFAAYPNIKDLDLVTFMPKVGDIAYYNHSHRNIALSSRKSIFEHINSPVENIDEINKFEKEKNKRFDAFSEEEKDEFFVAYDAFAGMSEEERSKDKGWQMLENDMPKITEHIRFVESKPQKIGGDIIGVKVKDNDYTRSILAHEIQHAIQMIEGFSYGSNPEALKNDEVSDLIFERLKKRKEIQKALEDDLKDTYERLERVRDTKRLFIRSDDGSEQIQKAIDNANKEILSLQNKYDYLVKQLDKVEEYDTEELRNLTKEIEHKQYELYNRVSGEVEARNVESRINMTPEQRSHSLASETEDVGRQDQIFLNKYGEKMGMVSKDLFDKYPTWLSGQTTGTGQHTTQITSTVNTYKKIGEWMKSQGMKGASILDASSGLGKGTEALRDMGFNVEDVEPYPSETRTKPTYLKYEDIKGKYDVVISNAVLNVIPDDWRADVLKNMADKVKPGGKMIINVRDAKEMERQKQKIELDSPSEILVTDKTGNIRAYQKGFTQKELADWIQSELGDGWTIETAKPSNSGISGRAVVVTRNTETPLRYRKVTDSMQKQKMSEEEKSRMANSATSLAESINTPIKVISAEEAPEGAKNSKGYYDTRTGEVTIVLDNNTSSIDVQRTVAHEVIGHKGLRGLLGAQNYYKIMNAVYDNLPQDEKDKINEAARRNGWQMYTAMDEYLAEQAENMVWDAKSASLWQNVKHYLAEAMRTLGFIVKPNLKDARYWLWLSKNQLKRGNVMSSIKRNALLAKLDKLGLPEQKVEEQDHLGEPRYAFSNGNYVDSATYDAIEQNLKSNSFYWKEAFIDYMQAYQVFQNEMAKGLKNGLMDNQNALIGENALTSAIEQQQSDYMRMQLKPLQDIIKRLQPEFGKGEEGIRNIENYLMMKHGLERNRVLFMRDWFTAEASRKIENDGQLTPEGQLIYTSMYQSIWYEYTNGNIDEAERDRQLKAALTEAHLQYLNDVMSQFNSIKNIELQSYEWGVHSLAEAYKNIDDFINQHANFEADKQDKSGLTALKEFFSGNKYEDAAIINQVQSYDDMIGSDMADKLMQAVQAVSQFALDEDYKNGLVTKEGYNRAKNMFRYYIPLRGFDETTMEDVYEYMTYSKGTGAKSLVHAKGRTSKAGSPLATAANMALNAIARGLRNQNKQRAYRLVNTWLKDNPTSVPPAIVTDLWVGLDASGNDTVFTPDITDDMTAEEIREEIEKFKDKMRIMEGLGKASKVKSEASFRHRFSSDNHKNEHIVPLMINGRAKVIIFNGNPRPAQALRGDLAPTVNKEFGLDKIMGRINRVMAGAFTSYNPTFMATNLLRDTGFANNNIAIKEGGEYYAKFLKNQATLLTKNIGKYAKLKWDYDKGIAPRNEMEQYFYEFMKNGGKTGFVNQQDIAKLEKLLAENNQNFSALNAGTVVAKYTINAIKAANDRIENINRFAVYMTSRQMGRSVMRSIYDAKEVSVNFNRKGAAGNTGRTPNATANMKLAANLASITRGSYLFFNAGVQSLNLLSKNIKGHPIKSAAYIVGIPLLLGGFVIPMLNQIIAEAAGDGDDDPYANLPEWTRRNNICIYLGNGRFLKIPLPIELRAFYGLGDIAAGYLVNEHLKSEKNMALDMGSQLTQILPVDFLGEGQDLFYTFTPDAAKPLIQIKTNTDWTGKPIYKDSEWNKYEPEYTKAFKNEFEPFVNLSKWINEVSGGSDHVKGSFDGKWNNPAIWHAVIQGYGGGAVMDVVRIGSLSRRLATMDSKGLTTKEVPIVKAILETPSEKTQYYRMLNKFYNYQEKNEEFKHNIEEWGKSASPLDHAKFLRHTNPNNPSREMKIRDRFREYDRANKFINKVLDNPNLSEADREALEQQAVRLKVDLVKILDQIED